MALHRKKITIPLSRLKREYKEFGENVLELKEIQHLENTKGRDCLRMTLVH